MEQNNKNLENNLTENNEIKTEDNKSLFEENSSLEDDLKKESYPKEITKTKTEKRKNTEEENSFYAKTRRESEKEKLTKELTEKVALETAKKILGNINPYNQKEFLSLNDLEEYFEQNNQKNEQKLKNSQDINDDWYINDRKDFFNKNPDFTEEEFEKLLTNQEFVDFSKYRVGNEPLNTIYSQYKMYNEKIEKLASSKAELMYRNKISSPGSLSKRFLTNSSSFDNMSEQDFEKMIQDAKKGYYLNLK